LIGERRITIKGRPGDVKAARQYIQDTIDGTDSGSRPPMGSGPPPPGGSSTVISIPAFRVGLVIGRGGETIRDLQDRSGARIAISPDNMPGSTEREVTITGSDAAVQQAKALIEEVVASDNRGVSERSAMYHEQMLTRSSHQEEEVTVRLDMMLAHDHMEAVTARVVIVKPSW
jgi:predicted PilT family ATPase